MLIDTTQLPETLYWENEQAWKPWAASHQRAVNGALDIQIAALSYGRPITLAGGVITRAELATLRILLETAPDTSRVLTLNDGTTHDVVIDLTAGGVEAEQFFQNKNPGADEPYRLKIHLITVEPV